MTRPVSVVMPCLDDRDLLARSLPPLLAELGRRALADEVVVVDDTGRDVLAGWLAAEFPACRAVAQGANGGFARALLAGVEAARHELVFCMNPDVIVREGFLDPLVACMDEGVFAVAPRVLLRGEEDRVESITELAFEGGLLAVRQPGLARGDAGSRARPREIAFAVGGTCLLRRSQFLATGGMDPLYEPFYLEDLDLCFAAWRAGRRVLYQPASVVEHHHRGTIGKIVEEPYVRAVIEKNRLLFQWKWLDSEELVREHLAALARMAVDAWLLDRRDELQWLVLALDQLDEVLAARPSLPEVELGFAEVVARSRGASA